ncbi:hypothetical protein KH172YL63_05680 [Bacillus sp. KH172YL63]|nr:hypothetical protein KH172YL63_05680 [Bacillus sp. KH172YL63]
MKLFLKYVPNCITGIKRITTVFFKKIMEKEGGSILLKFYQLQQKEGRTFIPMTRS